MKSKQHISAILMFVMVLGGILSPSIVMAETNIAVFMSDSLTSTMRTLRGAHKIVERSNQNVVFHTFYVGKNDAGDSAAIAETRALRSKVVITLGSSATHVAQEYIKDIPIVFAGVMYPELSGFVESNERPGGNITGASLDIPVEVQFKYFNRILPYMDRIGILYTKATAGLVKPAADIANALDMQLIAVQVETEKDIPAALDSLAKSTDGICSVADPELFNPQATRYILLNTIRKGIPFMGFSRNVVESGALFALDFDYKAIGRQAGGIVNTVLSGQSPARIEVSTADIIWFHYNEKTAKYIKVTIPEELVAIAKAVYR